MKDVLKQLRIHINAVKANIDNIKLEISSRNRELTAKEKELNELKKKLESLEYKSPVVSEHAYLRYFERVLGYDLQEISKEILSEDVLALMETLGNSGKYPNKKGYRLVLKDNVVVTIEK